MRGIVRRGTNTPNRSVPTDVLCHSRGVALDSPRDRSDFVALSLRGLVRRTASSGPERRG